LNKIFRNFLSVAYCSIIELYVREAARKKGKNKDIVHPVGKGKTLK
jgi:hypothetical protein